MINLRREWDLTKMGLIAKNNFIREWAIGGFWGFVISMIVLFILILFLAGVNSYG